MKKQLECKQCGHDNELKSVFCRDCGAKLDHSNIKISKVKDDDGTPGPLKKLFRLVQFLVLLVIIAGAVVILWPVQPVGEVGDAAQAEEFSESIKRLYDACENGIRLEAIVNERAINAHLAETVKRHQAEGGGGPALDNINVMIDKGLGVRVVTKVKLGPVPLTYTITGVPIAGQGPFRMDIREAKLGILPIPPAAQDALVVSKMKRIFEGLEPERFVLDRLEKIEAARAKVRVTTKGS